MSEIVKAEPNEVFLRAKAMLDNEATMADDSLSEWIRGKLAAISVADDFMSINAIMQASGMTASKDLVGRTLEILDFATRESSDAIKANGGSQLEKYAIIKAVDTNTGEELIVDGGGDQFVIGMVRMRDLYGFPFKGTVVGNTTASGNTLLSWVFQDPQRPKIQ